MWERKCKRVAKQRLILGNGNTLANAWYVETNARNAIKEIILSAGIIAADWEFLLVHH